MVSWEDHKLKTHKCEVLLSEYFPQSVVGLKVHFLRNGEVKDFAGPVYLGHPDYPLKGKEAELNSNISTEKVL